MTAQAKPAARQYALEISRIVDAPRDVAFSIWTTPQHLARWWGPKDFTSTCERLEFREGGAYRWVFGSGERTMGVSGTFDEVVVPSRLVSTEQFDDFPVPSVNTLLLAAVGDDRTVMTLTVVYPDRATRDGWVASGMTEGLGVGYDRLDAVLDEPF